MTVLLVDDSPVMRRFVARTLEMIGLDATILQAENGREGMKLALSARPDLVITDLNMPFMTGSEMVAAMQATAELQNIPVLVLTADRSSLRPEELIRAGAAAYVTKPVTPQLLRESLRSLLAVGQ